MASLAAAFAATADRADSSRDLSTGGMGVLVRKPDASSLPPMRTAVLSLSSRHVREDELGGGRHGGAMLGSGGGRVIVPLSSPGWTSSGMPLASGAPADELPPW